MQPLFSVVVTLLLSLSLSACSEQNSNGGGSNTNSNNSDIAEEGGEEEEAHQQQNDEQEHRQLHTQILHYMGQNRADDIRQCEIIAVGHRPCGGAEQYVVFSTRDMDIEERHELEENLKEFNELDAEIKASQPVMSTCEVLPQPDIELRDGRCVAADDDDHSIE